NDTTTLPSRAMGVTRRASAARTAATTARRATATRAQRTNLTAPFLSIPNRNRHAGAPERQFLRPKGHTRRLRLPADGAKVTRFPGYADAVRDESRGAAADVRGAVYRRHVEHVEIALTRHPHQPGAADEVRPQRVLRPPVRQRD